MGEGARESGGWRLGLALGLRLRGKGVEIGRGGGAGGDGAAGAVGAVKKERAVLTDGAADTEEEEDAEEEEAEAAGEGCSDPSNRFLSSSRRRSFDWFRSS